MKVLVTGGNGFTGSHLVDRLLREGLDVRCLVRRTSNLRWLEGKPVELSKFGRLEDPDVVTKALVDVDMLFHVLGTLTAANRQAFDEVNVKPVRMFLDACAGKSGFRRFVLVGSHGAAGPNPDATPLVTEADACHPVSDYGRSKLAAEDLTHRYAGKVPWTIVRPSVMYGPRDVNLYKLFRCATRGFVPVFGSPDKRISLAHVRDVADGIYKAGFADNSVGKTYFLASEEPSTAKDVKAAMEHAAGRQVRSLRVPQLAVKTMMLYSDVMSLFGRHLLMNRDRLVTMTYGAWACDVRKAKDELGCRQTISLHDGFAETYRWYRDQGWL